MWRLWSNSSTVSPFVWRGRETLGVQNNYVPTRIRTGLRSNTCQKRRWLNVVSLVNGRTLCYAHRVCLCVLCGSENKQRLFPYTALTDWFLQQRFNTLKLSGHYMYHKFNIQHFHVLPTQCIYVFCVDLRTNSDYFPIHH